MVSDFVYKQESGVVRFAFLLILTSDSKSVADEHRFQNIDEVLGAAEVFMRFENRINSLANRHCRFCLEIGMLFLVMNALTIRNQEIVLINDYDIFIIQLQGITYIPGGSN